MPVMFKKQQKARKVGKSEEMRLEGTMGPGALSLIAAVRTAAFTLC